MLLAGCTVPPRQSLRFGLGTAPVTLDPRYATDAVSYRICHLIYRNLVDFDNNFKPIPALAEWRRETPTHYRFILRKDGRRFHDHTRLNAEDVRATYASIIASGSQSPLQGQYTMIERVEAPDLDTVDFYLRKPDPLFPGRLTVGILPARLISKQHPFNRQPVGSGPLQFMAWPYEGRLVLKRLTDGQQIEFITVLDPTVRVLKLLRGELDLVQGDLAPELVLWLAKKTSVRVHRGPGDTFTYLGFNLQDPVTGQLPVRQAIAHAVDRQAIIRYVLGNAGRTANTLLPPEHWVTHNALPGYDYDLATARRLLAAAGYEPLHPLRLSYKISNNPLRVRLATVIQYQLRQVGIEVSLQSFDWGTLYGDIKAGRFQMFSLSWVGLKLPDIFHYAFHRDSMPPGGANRGRFQDPVVDALIEQAEQSNELAVQNLLYREIQERIHRLLPYVPLWYEDHVLVTRANIQGYPLALDGNFDGLLTTKRVSFE